MRKTKELETRLDSIRDLEQNAVDPTTLHNDATRLIRTLENRLDKALIKFNEARAGGETGAGRAGRAMRSTRLINLSICCSVSFRGRLAGF